MSANQRISEKFSGKILKYQENYNAKSLNIVKRLRGKSRNIAKQSLMISAIFGEIYLWEGIITLKKIL